MSKAETNIYDLFVVGGGINGVGIARDAVGRGFSVFLAEKDDLAKGTSSGSTKLIHGGLRYLEHHEFNLVRKALMEREVLWKIAPHIVHPLRFVLPHHKGLRPAWFLRLGLFLYDYIGGRKLLPATKKLNLQKDAAGKPILDDFKVGFEYSDCWVDDARLVVLNAMSAREMGAEIRTRNKVEAIKRQGDHWEVTVRDLNSDQTETIQAKMLVNATGPWIDHFLNETDGAYEGDKPAHNVRLVQGSHIVVNKLYDHDRCYIFQNEDGRIIFAIPYENDYTLLGTTDYDFKENPDKVGITEGERDYICKSASAYFKQKISPDDVVWSYAGVRPLYDDGASKAQEATRDYILRLDGDENEPQMLNIFGGKITTYRKLAEASLEKIESVLGTRKGTWTDSEPLPGGDFPHDGRKDLAASIYSDHPYMDKDVVNRMVRQYGTNTREILKNVTSSNALGEDFGHGLYAVEIDYLRRVEFAQSAEDILFRRTKLGVRMSEAEKKKVAEYLQISNA